MNLIEDLQSKMIRGVQIIMGHPHNIERQKNEYQELQYEFALNEWDAVLEQAKKDLLGKTAGYENGRKSQQFHNMISAQAWFVSDDFSFGSFLWTASLFRISPEAYREQVVIEVIADYDDPRADEIMRRRRDADEKRNKTNTYLVPHSVGRRIFSGRKKQARG